MSGVLLLLFSYYYNTNKGYLTFMHSLPNRLTDCNRATPLSSGDLRSPYFGVKVMFVRMYGIVCLFVYLSICLIIRRDHGLSLPSIPFPLFSSQLLSFRLKPSPIQDQTPVWIY